MSKRSDTFEVVIMKHHGFVELKGETDPTFLLKGKRVKFWRN